MSSQGFDPKDLEEICARKPREVRIKKADFKELGRNVLLGSIDVAVDSVKTTSVVISMAEKTTKTNESTNYLQYSWEDRPYESENRDI
ncbi:hypothetical protein [Yersinia enterocolitica]|uniref:Uncharacterized protein n=1 Tax=Yersinia enterocolitica serotype O:8 / biotype 1B (strain NCTC 13174 / 8081) TaxID=393305 RepID=A1JPY5_YERE8|nr:hypothetical protein [Yersinia enterocolitica]AJJ25607.1 hypothetical protein CH49_2907 [Yersinia enterocolitica]CAL13486.1 hypothetical protein YE3464 [Yersinia enterocolitica subsp. enterocolitica 8081]CRY28766.1 Uncharacterised protein [Yersinia enterocolitica]HDL8282103.1 hypothetical protein [Yersinia enterocolitica]HDM8291801.1 hypothetical protein [Yersinia enterocolitica]